MKTKSGIACFQEDKGLGAWFSRLLEVVSTMDSAQPEQAIEPSTDVGYEYDIELESDNSPPTSSDKKKENLFRYTSHKRKNPNYHKELTK